MASVSKSNKDRETKHSSIEPQAQTLKFKEKEVKNIVAQILSEVLRRKAYDHDASVEWARYIATQIKEKLRDLDQPFKYVVQVVVGEMKDSGFYMAFKSTFDHSDKAVYDHFTNEELFGVASVFAVGMC